MRQSLSIIIPAKNEKNYIEPIVARLLNVDLPQNTEIIFIEGHSTDGTADEIDRVIGKYQSSIKIRHRTQNGFGKADAVWEGFYSAQNDIIMILDADMTVEPEELPSFYDAIIKGDDMFINGSRFLLPMEKGAMRPINYMGNISFAFLLSVILMQKLTDTLCGTKAIYRKHFDKIKENGLINKLDDPFADFTLILGASSLGLKIVEIPVSYKRRIFDRTKIRRFRDGWKLLKIISRYLFK